MMPIEIDGSHGEGGGQIIRTAVSLSALTGNPVEIKNIRSGRKQPGLKPQHLAGVKAVSDMCHARVSGLEVSSTELEFVPKEVAGGKYQWDVGTAGSVTLVLQAILPATVFSENGFDISVKGGTNVSWSPPVEYFKHVFCDYLKIMGLDIKFDVLNYGFYPKGGGKVSLVVNPSEFFPINIIDRGDFIRTDVWSIASRDLEKAKVAERQAAGFKKAFGNTQYGKINILYVDSLSTGSDIHAHNHYENCKIGAESLGSRGKKAEAVGKEAAEKLLSNLENEGSVDEHAEDMLIPYMALAARTGESKIRVPKFTKHTQTNIWVVEKFLPVEFYYDKRERTLSCSRNSEGR